MPVMKGVERIDVKPIGEGKGPGTNFLTLARIS